MLLQIREPVNKFPDFVRYIVRRLKVLCPCMGKKRIAQFLARSGVHLGVTTVKRILEEKNGEREGGAASKETTAGTRASKPVTPKYPNHVWHVDLSVMPTSAGFWVPWKPWARPQVWPFSW